MFIYHYLPLFTHDLTHILALSRLRLLLRQELCERLLIDTLRVLLGRVRGAPWWLRRLGALGEGHRRLAQPHATGHGAPWRPRGRSTRLCSSRRSEPSAVSRLFGGASSSAQRCWKLSGAAPPSRRRCDRSLRRPKLPRPFSGSTGYHLAPSSAPFRPYIASKRTCVASKIR